MICSVDTKIEHKKGLLAIHHLLFELTCPLNLIVVVFYWGLLHAETMQLDEFQDFVPRFLMFVNHITPFVFNWLNFSITDVIIAPNHWKVLNGFTPIYACVNYFETRRSGKPLYSFLTWEDVPTSIGVVLAIHIFGCISFFAFSWLTKRIKRKPGKHKLTRSDSAKLDPTKEKNEKKTE